ncbi:gamma-glutamylcyclotransferase family protein [uncultured Roseibium sp.]|uniref:gamma-glutamylcyclotransferase family protein n=1 Tax=uncultured Roseibium sp. TaxID=1936171 RepID=UPI002637F410|nr:gamma-glutamylcyclotransferase family protein [uncultured Roseibium sp.]
MTITYFGYGSLVNVDTIPAAMEVTPGRLSGWVREWRVCGIGEDGQGRCALSVRKKQGSEIWGVMAREAKEGLAQLEHRERRYEKVEAIGTAFACEAKNEPGPADLFLFKAAPDHLRWGNDAHPILQSYLDCVLAGYFGIWGEDGIDHFLETTDGWQAPVLSDRHKPHYPRSIRLERDLALLVDEKLTGKGVEYMQP